MRFAKQIAIHRLPIRPNRKVSIAEFSQNRVGSSVPTGPTKRRVSIHIPGIDLCSCVQEQLDGLFSAESSGPMKGCFGLGSAISHETTCFNRWPGDAIWIRA